MHMYSDHYLPQSIKNSKYFYYYGKVISIIELQCHIKWILERIPNKSKHFQVNEVCYDVKMYHVKKKTNYNFSQTLI